MLLSIRTLFVSHSIVFIGGCVVGKLINQDELETYRSIHETNISKFKRHATTAAFTILTIGTIYIVVRMTTSTSSSSRGASPRVIAAES